MKRSKWIGATLAMVLMGGGLSFAEETGVKSEVSETKSESKEAKPEARESKPARAEAEKARPGRLTKPWSDLKSLTDEQKAKIIEIHRQAVAAKKEIDRKEKEDVMALLTPEQQAELIALAESEAAARKAREAEKKQAQKSEGEKGKEGM